MPEGQLEAENHKYTLLATTSGHCSIMESAFCKSESSLLPFALIPLPVLAQMKLDKVSTGLKTCGLALLEVVTAIESFQQLPVNEIEFGKAWGKYEFLLQLCYSTHAVIVIFPVNFLQYSGLWRQS